MAASTDRAVTLAQQAPLPITVDQHAALVKDPIEQKRRIGFHPLQVGDVNQTAGDALQPEGELKPR